jgi:NMD protein affecting ribosome stability and mRNA decay
MICRRCGKEMNKYHEQHTCNACLLKRRDMSDSNDRGVVSSTQRKAIINNWAEYIGG